MDNIKNKTALVTGAARGIGLICAQNLLKHGAKTVAILDLNNSPGRATVAALEKEFGKRRARFFPCDVSKPEDLEETFKTAWDALNGVDILINNAGIFNDKRWRETILINVCGVVQGSILAMNYMGKHKGGQGGTIVNVASTAVLIPLACMPVYSASKQSVLTFSHCLQTRYEKTGIRILAICPGPTMTAIFDDVDNKFLNFSDPEELDASNVPMQTPETTGEAIINLIQKGSNGSVWVTEESKPTYAVELQPYKKSFANILECVTVRDFRELERGVQEVEDIVSGRKKT